MNVEKTEDIKLPLPQWARLFLHVGFPSAIAITLLAAMLGWIPSPIMDRLNRMETQMWQQTMIMRTICYGLGANTDRRSCEPWREVTQ